MKITVSETTKKEIEVEVGDCLKTGTSYVMIMPNGQTQVVWPITKSVNYSIVEAIGSEPQPCSKEEYQSELKTVLDHHAKQLEQ